MVRPPQETSTIEGEVIKNGFHIPRSVSRVIMADKTYRFFSLKEYVSALKRVRKGTYQSEMIGNKQILIRHLVSYFYSGGDCADEDTEFQPQPGGCWVRCEAGGGEDGWRYEPAEEVAI
jgi:hypothetical protein